MLLAASGPEDYHLLGGNGYSSGSGSPTTPTPPSNGSGVVTINVVAINGAQSFSPNPATVPAGQMVIWHNVDTITHHVVLNDRSVDTGDLGRAERAGGLSDAARRGALIIGYFGAGPLSLDAFVGDERQLLDTTGARGPR